MNQENPSKKNQLEYTEVLSLWTEALSLWKFYHEYRQKIFQYFLLFNGAFLTLILSDNTLVLAKSIYQQSGKFWLAIFAALTTVTIFCTELRTIQLADSLFNQIKDLEKKLDFSIMTKEPKFGIK